MNKGSETIKKIYSIGNDQIKCQARNSKPVKKQPNKLYKIILYYKRNEYLIAMKFIYQKIDYFGSKNENTFISTEPEIFGPVNKLKHGENHNIDEIEMTFEKDEEIYSIQGCCENNSIPYLSINTIYGQYVEFGQIGTKHIFHWDFYYNLLLIDSFTIGWDDEKINYFMCTTIVIQSFNEEKKNIALTDITELPINNTEPIYQSEMIGVVNDETSFIDDLHNLDLFNYIREGHVYLHSISVYYEGKRITRIDTEYVNTLANIKIGNSHISNNFEETHQKTYIILSEKDDYINYFSVSHGKNNVRSLCFKTASGKTLNCVVGKEGNKKE